MNKITLITKREFLTRVQKRSFIIMTILGPILFAAVMILPGYLGSLEDSKIKRIAVIDETHIFSDVLTPTSTLIFDFLPTKALDSLKRSYVAGGYQGILYIPKIVAYSPNTVQFFSEDEPGLSTTQYITNKLEKEMERQKLLAYNIGNLDQILQSVKTNIALRTIRISGDGSEKESKSGINMVMGYLSGFLIYIFIFMYGAMVMRGVMEEKTNRIVEVIVSSVRPFQLMMGKILGVALVGLTQFVLWAFLTFALVGTAQKVLLPDVSTTLAQQAAAQDIMKASETKLNDATTVEAPVQSLSGEDQKMKEIFDSIRLVDFPVMLVSFLFFFAAGYLLYASLFAAIGSAVDNDTDTQQFMFPVTIPLVVAIVVLLNTLQNPNGDIAFWFSMIPLTSPVVMMARIPFGVPWYEILISGTLLVASFIGSTWMAAKIYRTGILMYGKKVTYSEIWKWLRYRN